MDHPLTATTASPTVTAVEPSRAPRVRPSARHRPDEAPAVRAAVAAHLDKWRNRNRYHHAKIAEYLRFVVPSGESVLLVGCEDGRLLREVKPSRGVGVDPSPEMLQLARKRNAEFDYVRCDFDNLKINEKFEYIILPGITGEVRDLIAFLKQISTLCTPSSRVILLQHNYLWWPVIRVASRLGLVRPQSVQNWLSASNMQTCLNAAGLEVTEVRRKMLSPRKMFGLGSLINTVGGLLPVIDRFASTEMLIARLKPHETDWQKKTCTICLTVRDEHDNIEPMVESVPELGSHTEILFVEGHSNDGTRDEIRRVAAAHPDKDVKLVIQDGIGQGDAIKKGFAEASGDVIILLEADQTSPPEDTKEVFELIAGGHAEYVNGTRFIYPHEPGAMPWRNVAGNLTFALWFTWFLGRRTSDVLCGIKGIDRRQYQRLYRNWGFLGVADPFGDFELIFGVSRLGLKTCEMPTRYMPRVYGSPKTRFFKHGLMLVRTAFSAVRKFKCT